MTTQFTEIADRVFVGRYPQWDVNVGVVVGTDGICVVDTRGTLRQGEEVREGIARLARSGVVTHVVNTHVHFDHVLGNAAFPSARKTAHAQRDRRDGRPHRPDQGGVSGGPGAVRRVRLHRSGSRRSGRLAHCHP